MKRSLVIVVLGLVAAMTGCGSSSPDAELAPAGSSAHATSLTTASPTAAVPAPVVPTLAPAAPTTSAPPARQSPPTTTRPAPTLDVVLYAKAGQVPPGRVGRLDAPAWKATGSGWDAGDVELVVRPAAGGEAVLSADGRAGESGTWEQIFVLTGAKPGTYVAVASQGSRQAESSFVLPQYQPAEEVVATGRTGAATWTLTARRSDTGLVCALLRVAGSDTGQVCQSPTEEDFNGDDTLRYGVEGGSFLIGIGVSGVDKVRVQLTTGAIVEATGAPASFTSARFVALPLPSGGVIGHVDALSASGTALTSFTLNR